MTKTKELNTVRFNLTYDEIAIIPMGRQVVYYG